MDIESFYTKTNLLIETLAEETSTVVLGKQSANNRTNRNKTKF